MSENGNGTANAAVVTSGDNAVNPKKPRLENEVVEEKDFDEETQKALEEIDATQNEIDSLNERKKSFTECYIDFVIVINYVLIWNLQDSHIF